MKIFDFFAVEFSKNYFSYIKVQVQFLKHFVTKQNRIKLVTCGERKKLNVKEKNCVSTRLYLMTAATIHNECSTHYKVNQSVKQQTVPQCTILQKSGTEYKMGFRKQLKIVISKPVCVILALYNVTF